MSFLTKWRLVLLFGFFTSGTSINLESLTSRSPIYGLSSIATGNFSDCSKQLAELRNAVGEGKVWALKVLDASGRPPEGFLYGNNYWLGSHVECIEMQNPNPFEIRNDKVNHTTTPFDYPPYELIFAVLRMRHNSTLQYHMRLPLDYTVQLGLCIPKSCSQEDIFNLSERFFANNPLEFQREYQVALKVTHVKILQEDGFWMLKLPKTIVFLVIVTVILTLTVVGTIYDVKEHNRAKNLIQGHNNLIGTGCKQSGLPIELVIPSNENDNFPIENTKTWAQVLKCFSFYSNVKKWARTKVSGDSLHIANGLRFLAMVWVILVHTTYFQSDFISNPPHGFRLSERFLAQIFSNSTYCVDTFLFLSGFLLAFTFFKRSASLEESRQTDYLSRIGQFFYMLVHRILRLTPTYIIALLLCNLTYTFYSKSSVFYFSENSHEICDQYWWRNLLYINNLYPRSEMCLSWSWYLSIDMQFFVIGSFLVLLSTMCFKAAAVMVILTIIVQVLATTYTSYSIEYVPTLDDQLEQLDTLYDLPWNRIGPYMVGIATGYLLVVKLQNKLVLRERTRLTLWVVFPLLNLWILFTLYTRQLSVEFSAFYMGVSRTLWGVGIAWFVIALSTGNARLLEKLFSYRAWVPLGRLTYCAYLLNPLVVTMTALGYETGITISVPQMALAGNGTFMLTMLMSFVFSTLFESPFILLSKLLLKRDSPKPKSAEQDIPSEQGDTASSCTISTIP